VVVGLSCISYFLFIQNGASDQVSGTEETEGNAEAKNDVEEQEKAEGKENIVVQGGELRLTSDEMQAFAKSHADRFQMDFLEDDKLHVILCGTGSPAMDPDRAQSCTAILTKDTFLIFDAGDETASNVDEWNLPLPELEAIFLTHLHSDHILDVPEFSDKSLGVGRDHELPVFGPERTEDVVNAFRDVFQPDLDVRSKVEGISADTMLVGNDIKIEEKNSRKLIYENESGVKVYAFLVEHPPWENAFGYRIDYNGQSVVISGDTKKSENLARHAEGADILIHEAFNKELMDQTIEAAKSMENKNTEIEKFVKRASGVQDYHTTPVEAAEIAKEAEVNHLVYSHIIPPFNDIAKMEELFVNEAKNVFEGKITIGEDGMHFVLPGNEVSSIK